MKFFKTLAELLKGGLTATLVIKMTADGKMTVITDFKNETGGVCDSLTPFTLKGTPEELDEGFLDSIKTPAEEVCGLVSNIDAFRKAVKEAEKNAMSTAGKSSTVADAAKKAELERKQREEEARATKEKFDKAMEAAKTAKEHGNFHTAEKLLEFALTLTADKKAKAAIEKQIKEEISNNKEGFFCNDNAEAAETALKSLKDSFEKPADDVPAEEHDTEPEDADGPAEETGETAEDEQVDNS